MTFDGGDLAVAAAIVIAAGIVSLVAYAIAKAFKGEPRTGSPFMVKREPHTPFEIWSGRRHRKPQRPAMGHKKKQRRKIQWK